MEPKVIHAILIKAEGTISDFDYDVTDGISLTHLQEAVGGWIERAPTRARELTMYVNEEGKILNLPRNPLATELLFDGKWDFVAGDAVVCGEPDDEGYDTSIPPALEKLILSIGRSLAVG